MTGGNEPLFEIVDDDTEISDGDSDNSLTYTTDITPSQTSRRKRCSSSGSDLNFQQQQYQQQHHQQQQQEAVTSSSSAMTGMPQNFQNLLIISTDVNQTKPIPSYGDPRLSPNGISTQLDLSSSMDSSDQHLWYQGGRPAGNRYDTFNEVPPLPPMRHGNYTKSPRQLVYDPRHTPGFFIPPPSPSSSSKHTSPISDDHYQHQQQQQQQARMCKYLYLYLLNIAVFIHLKYYHFLGFTLQFHFYM